ncbi:hypothetical protein E2C01_062242 [Portunus trituberculatus]|uniref:Uncharacterized protein n=1 Tax=Portunus trituberculatus TaxID=210409 RepID=A0A5B7HAF0_PORTR|nr:hypothetical protein [Portunus trituberculatus]
MTKSQMESGWRRLVAAALLLAGLLCCPGLVKTEGMCMCVIHHGRLLVTQPVFPITERAQTS